MKGFIGGFFGVTLLSNLASASIGATGTIASVANGLNWDYTIHLTNTGTTNIGMFWFAWIPGANFMPDAPLSVSNPVGWSNIVTGAGPDFGDGFGIQWSSSTTPLLAGTSSDFLFTSPTSPTIMNGQSPLYPSFRTTTSFVYIGASDTGPFSSFVVTPAVPEPAAWTVLALGSFALLRRRSRR